MSIKNKDNYTALELAQQGNHTVIVELIENHVPMEPEEETIMVKPAVD